MNWVIVPSERSRLGVGWVTEAAYQGTWWGSIRWLSPREWPLGASSLEAEGT